jgi:hypothetical protein
MLQRGWAPAAAVVAAVGAALGMAWLVSNGDYFAAAAEAASSPKTARSASGQRCGGGPNAGHGRFGWPVKPFYCQHPIRATFGEPRGIVGAKLKMQGERRARALSAMNQVQSVGRRLLHTGVDIVARDGTPVYAIESGTVKLGGIGYDRNVTVGRFGYWHITPRVTDGQRAVARVTVLGTIIRGQGHLHLTRYSRPGGIPVNPFLSGGLRPYRDTAAPQISSLAAYAPDGTRQSLSDLRGPAVLAVRTQDIQSSGGYQTGIYSLNYSLTRAGRTRPTIGPIHAMRFGRLKHEEVPTNTLFTLGSARHGVRTKFWYRISDGSPTHDGLLHTESIPPGRYRLRIQAADARGNERVRVFTIQVAGRERGARPSPQTRPGSAHRTLRR